MNWNHKTPLNTCRIDMNIQHSTEFLENEAQKVNIPKLKLHLHYLNNVYNYCFEIQHSLDRKSPKKTGELLNAQMILLMRVTDFLRCIYLNIVIGYPEQAGTLASSVFELVHTGIYFKYVPEVINKWWNGNNEKRMPQLIGKNTYKDLVEHNCNKMEGQVNDEWRIYKELCWMKHSHPVMHDVLIENDLMRFQIGPYTDERALGNAKFILVQSGRLTEMFISSISFPESILSNDEYKIKLERLNFLFDERKQLI